MVAFWLSGDDAQHVQDALIFSTIFGIGKKQAQLPIISDIFIYIYIRLANLNCRPIHFYLCHNYVLSRWQ